MSVTFAHRDQCEMTGNWRLVRRTLGLQAFGINLVDIPPGEQIPEHDEIARDQEEVFYVLSGTPTLVVDGEDHLARAGCFARLDPEHLADLRQRFRRLAERPEQAEPVGNINRRIPVETQDDVP